MRSVQSKRQIVLPTLLLAAAAVVACHALHWAARAAFSVPSVVTPRQQTQQLSQKSIAPAASRFAGVSQLSSAVVAVEPADESDRLAARPGMVLAATALAAVAAAAEASSSESATEEKSSLTNVWSAVKLPVYVALWYFFNVQYNIQNKLLLKAFDASMAVSWIQMAAGIPIAGLMWLTGILKRPKVSTADLAKLAPVGAAFAGGQVATVASLGAVAVSFTHVVKALEPAVNAIASAFVLGQVFHPLVYASLLPVFAGVALASASELSFTLFGFATAMASNFFFVTRNVLATKFGGVGEMGDDATTRKTNQLAVLTAVASVVLLPLALFAPGGLLSIPAAWSKALKAGVTSNKIIYLLASSGFHFFMYQMSSFWVLSCVPPITHSVLNTLKRVVIIVMSIIVFRTPVTAQGLAGTATAIGGVLLYSLTKAHFSKKK
mmetsp:Transcript_11855/g.21644  ORF Transcript_11855/g.21644 Transcript_11855/m.21644 type:complete len:436 (+) Transcript_11855:102-1409(+)